MDRALSLLAPLDAARRAWLALAARWGRRWVVERDRRVAVGLTFAVVSSLTLASLYPIALLALGPLVLGVPHLFSDVRYLVVREGLHKRPALWIAVGVPLLCLGAWADVRWGGVAVLGAALSARGGVGRRAALASIGALSVFAAEQYGSSFALVVAHLHNVFALFVLFAWRKPSSARLVLAPLGLYAAASAFVLLGLYEPLVRLTDGDSSLALHLDLDVQAASLAPHAAGLFGPRLAVFFAFAQSVHYAVWLRVLPDVARAAHTPRSFRQSARAAVRELSLPVALAALVLSLALGVYALHDVVAARDTYFRFALFHGYLEAAAFALFFCEGAVERAPRERGLGALPAASAGAA